MNVPFLYFELNTGSNLFSFRFFYFTARTLFFKQKITFSFLSFSFTAVQHVQFFLCFVLVMFMFFIYATVVVTWETIRGCGSVSDDNVCVPAHCPLCAHLNASGCLLLSDALYVPILAVFSFSFFCNLYRQQQVSCIMAEQVARKLKGDSPL